MKLPPQDTENKTKLHLDAMSQMTALLSEKDVIIEQKTDVIAEQKKRIAMLEEYLRLANSKRFGASSEQTPPQQGHLFNEVEAVAVDSPLPSQRAKGQNRSQATVRQIAPPSGVRLFE
ncbi:MAG: transposase [Paraglaciecola sp.]|jgi:transposase